MQAKWQGADLHNLLTMPIAELVQLYPQEKKDTLKGKKAYWKKKLERKEIEMPERGKGEPVNGFSEILKLHHMTPELAQEFTEQGFHVGYIKNSEGEIEYTVPLPNAKRKGAPTVEDVFPQVEASVIRPSKRRRAQKLGNLILGYGDGQVDFRFIRDPRTSETEVVPLQNLPMHRIILQMNAYYKPQTTINGGDFADFAGSSRFPADSNHFADSTTMSMQWIHDFYSQMVADNPNEKYGGDAKHVEVASNHGDRPRKKILKEAPELYNFYRPGEDYPAHTYYSMARLGDLGIIHPTGYPHGEYIYGDEEHPQILFKHGSASGKNAVYQEADRNPTINVVRWHNHGERMIKRTTREGKQLFYLILGSSCLNNSPVPGYANAIDDFNQPVKYHNQDHVNSFTMIRDYGEGRFEPVTIDVVDGKAFHDGMEWDGHTPFEWEHKYGYIKGNDETV